MQLDDRQYQIMEAIGRLQKGPEDLVDYRQIAEALRLDLEMISDKLDGLALAGLIERKLTVGAREFSLNAQSRRLLRERAEEQDRPPQARDTQQPATYDQKGWQADTVYNVAGNVYAGPAQNRQEPPGLEVADVRFELESDRGIAACLEVRNWTDRAKKVHVFVYPQSEEPLIPRTGSTASRNPTFIDAEDTEEIRVPLWLCRADPSKRPVIVSVEVRDALGRKTFAPDELIERLNAQIASQWPHPEGGE